MSIQTVVQKAPNVILDKTIEGAAMAGGVGVGMMLANAINAAVPQASLPLGPVTIGVGDVAAALIGAGVAVVGFKSGNALVKKAVDAGTTGIIASVVVNKGAQALGLPNPFNNPIPAGAVPAAFARSRNLYGGNIRPSNAYVGRSFAVNPA